MKRIIDIDEDYFEIIKYNVATGDKYKPFEIIADSISYEEMPQGEWITDGVGNITCSNCGFSLGSKVVKLLHPFDFPYCPDCGTKMKGGKEK